jgi:hypothetical protein
MANNETNPLTGSVPWEFPLAIPAATSGTQVPVVITNTVTQS